MENMITYREGYCTDISEGIKLFHKYGIDYEVDEDRGRLCGSYVISDRNREFREGLRKVLPAELNDHVDFWQDKDGDPVAVLSPYWNEKCFTRKTVNRLARRGFQIELSGCYPYAGVEAFVIRWIDDLQWKEDRPGKTVIAINAGPRKGWNTDKLVLAAGKGTETTGAKVEYISLYQLEKFTGCISCFSCKKEKTFGKCTCKDGLYEVLQKIRNADGLIIGSPNYLGNLTAGFRALYERLVFQSLTYCKEAPNCNEHMIPVRLIMTSNCSEEAYAKAGYDTLLDSYQKTLEKFVGPTEIFTCGDTLQVKDYSKYNWTLFDAEKKKQRHDETFETYLDRAFLMGARLFS